MPAACSNARPGGASANAPGARALPRGRITARIDIMHDTQRVEVLPQPCLIWQLASVVLHACLHMQPRHVSKRSGCLQSKAPALKAWLCPRGCRHAHRTCTWLQSTVEQDHASKGQVCEARSTVQLPLLQVQARSRLFAHVRRWLASRLVAMMHGGKERQHGQKVRRRVRSVACHP